MGLFGNSPSSFQRAAGLVISAAAGALSLVGCSEAKSQSAHPRWAITSNDNKQYLEMGTLTVVAGPIKNDTASIIDLSVVPPKLAVELDVPGSVQGPPLSVAIAPDESIALIASPIKLDAVDPTKAIPDNRVSVLDLTLTPPAVIATVTAGEQPSGIAISRDGKLALVANRNAGTISVFSIQGKVVTNVGTVVVADLAKTPVPDQKFTASVAITPDGKTAFATNDGDHRITLLKIEGTTVTKVKDFYAGLRPYAFDMATNGKFAVVGNVGYAQGDVDTVSLIDLEAEPAKMRVVDTVSVGLTPEGVKISPDGTYAVAVLHNGTNKAPTFPFYSVKGKLAVLKIEGKTLKKVAEADIGRWCQGAAFSPDSKLILVGCMVEKEVQIFEWTGSELKISGTPIAVSGGPAAIRTAER